MFEVKITTQFAAAHQLRNFGGKCEELHGHNWKIEVSLAGTKLNAVGLLIDFQEVKAATKKILSELDHSFLNKIPHFKERNPSSENIAAYLFERLNREFDSDRISVTKVTAWESDSACASFST